MNTNELTERNVKCNKACVCLSGLAIALCAFIAVIGFTRADSQLIATSITIGAANVTIMCANLKKLLTR